MRGFFVPAFPGWVVQIVAMLDVTVVIPVKNEAQNLPRCLERLSVFQQVLVVDSGSTDKSCSISEASGAEVLKFEWDGHFPKKRNWVLQNYSFHTAWVLFLDADEFITEAFVAELGATLPETDCVGFWLNYERWFLGKPLRHGDEFNKLALFKVGAGEYERIEEDSWSNLDMEIHEHPVLDGSVGEISAPIEHNEYRGLPHYIAKHNEYSTWEARRWLQLMGKAETGNLKPEMGESPVRDSDSGLPPSPSYGAASRSDPSSLQNPPSHSGFKSQVSSLHHLTPRQQKKYRHLDKWWAAPVYFLRGYFLKRGFLDGATGFHFALGKAIYFYQIRLKIRELRGR